MCFSSQSIFQLCNYSNNHLLAWHNIHVMCYDTPVILSSFRMQPLVYEEHLNWHLMHLFHTCKSGCFLSRCFLRVPILFTSLIGNTHTHKPKIHSFWFCWNLMIRSKVWFWPNINTNNVVIIFTLIPKLRLV